MADFCAGCVVPELSQDSAASDFAGWLGGLSPVWEPGQPRRAWGMCEGCGAHLFDNDGVRACHPAPVPEPVSSSPCPACLASAAGRLAYPSQDSGRDSARLGGEDRQDTAGQDSRQDSREDSREDSTRTRQDSRTGHLSHLIPDGPEAF